MSEEIGDVDSIGNILAGSTGCQQATQDIVQDLLFKNLSESYFVVTESCKCYRHLGLPFDMTPTCPIP